MGRFPAHSEEEHGHPQEASESQRTAGITREKQPTEDTNENERASEEGTLGTASNVDGELALSKRETAFAPTTYKLIFVSRNLPCFDLIMGCFH